MLVTFWGAAAVAGALVPAEAEPAELTGVVAVAEAEPVVLTGTLALAEAGPVELDGALAFAEAGPVGLTGLLDAHEASADATARTQNPRILNGIILPPSHDQVRLRYYRRSRRPALFSKGASRF